MTSGAVGLGPLLAGLLAEYAGWTTHLVFVVYLALLALATVAVLLVPETVETARPPYCACSGFPSRSRSAREFLSAALAMFAAFALVGLFVSLVPSFLGRELHRANHAAAGIVVFVLFACATGAQLALHRLHEPARDVDRLRLAARGLALLMLGSRRRSCPSSSSPRSAAGSASGS